MSVRRKEATWCRATEYSGPPVTKVDNERYCFFSAAAMMTVMMVHLRLPVLFGLFTIRFVPLGYLFIDLASFLSTLAVLFLLGLLVELLIILARTVGSSFPIFVLIAKHRHAVVVRITTVRLVCTATTVAAGVHGVVLVESTWRGERHAKLCNSARQWWGS